jgi:hypothetical protein
VAAGIEVVGRRGGDDTLEGATTGGGGWSGDGRVAGRRVGGDWVGDDVDG